VQIDGRSQLVITPSQIYWKHYAFARPGRHLANNPTLVNDYAWLPVWSSGDDNQPGESSPLPVTVRFGLEPVTLSQTLGRTAVVLVQQPDPENNNTLILEFNDSEPDGPDQYAVTLEGLDALIQPRLAIQVACVKLLWPTESNRVYQLQYCSALSTNEWRNLADPIPGFGTNAMHIDCPQDQQHHRYYRVLVLP
jgi:hypothetical protein